MRVIEFKGTKVYGYLPLKVQFEHDLTFLTGINGSGKTTIVRGISALISPNLSILASIRFESMQVTIENGNAHVVISARQKDDVLTLETSVTGETFSIPMILDDPSVTYRGTEKEADYFRDLELRNANHPVMQFLKGLPTPMFLGLERRGLSSSFSEDAYAMQVIRRRSRNIFGGSPARSLIDAIMLAERSFNTVQARQRDLTNAFRKSVILTSLTFHPAMHTYYHRLNQKELAAKV